MSNSEIADIPQNVLKIIEKQLDVLKSFSSISINKKELISAISEELIDEKNNTRIEKFVFVFYAKQLRDNPKLHRKYNSELIPDGVWQPLTRLLTAIRAQELKEVKIVRRKGKFDIKELRTSYFGEKILSDLPELGTRWMLTETEYRQIQIQCRKLELELPEIVEPTITEIFFEG